jgi:structural maintenance of chromosome 3 (chondroitin sulfate proteoglycan 6)
MALTASMALCTAFSKSQIPSSTPPLNSQPETGKLHISVAHQPRLTLPTSLFHVVVDNDTTASKVLDIMLKEKTGRVTFMPLNRLKPKVPPTPNAQDAIPLIDKLQFEPEYLKAFQQVFGKTCVCRDLTIAAAYVKSHGINTITLDGDRVDRKGSLTGGYHDVRRSRIDAIKAVQTWQARAEADRRRSKEVKTEILQVDQRITDMSGRVQRANARRTHAQEEREALMAEGYAMNRRREEALERVAALEREVEDLETEMSTVETKLEALQQELDSPFARGLSDEEVEKIDELVEEVSKAQQSLAELIATKNRVRNTSFATYATN